jgi:hypothetical protein
MSGATAIRTRTRADSDPLSRLLKPSAGETPQERQVRLEQEALARKISDAIDEQLRQERVQRTKSRKEIRILLLGGSTFAVPYSGDPDIISVTDAILRNRSVRKREKVTVFPLKPEAVSVSDSHRGYPILVIIPCEYQITGL